MGRGLEMAIKAMQYTENMLLVIVGGGDVENELKELARSMGLPGKDNIYRTGITRQAF